MVSRENKVVAVFVAAAMVLYLGLLSLTDLSFEIIFALLMLVGVVAPMMINNYLDNRSGA